MNASRRRVPLLLLIGFIPAVAVHAGWLDWLTKKDTNTTTAATAPTMASLSQEEIVRGLKEALAKGTQQAIAQLGQPSGFLTNLQVRIPMPEKLATVEKTLRTVGQGKLADEFVATMNHAAEAAVPEAAAIFGDSIKVMTVEDAMGILKGPDDAATQYFRQHGEARLTEKMLPIVQKATAEAGVTSAYKALVQKAGPAASLLGANAVDLDQYVTGKALDGLFVMIAAEEKRIRENPVARTTDLLKRVFGSGT